MNRIMVGIVAGAIGTFLMMPSAKAQSWQDMHQDREQIEHKESQINHDQRELNHDLRDGDYGAARHEEREINGREHQLQDERQDLHEDMEHRARDRRDFDDDD